MDERCGDELSAIGIVALAKDIQRIVDAGVARILPDRAAEFEARFASDGDMAYGALNTELFAPVRNLLRERGLQAKPRLPGRFQDSREWGNHDETHQQRWMWSVIVDETGRRMGTIAVGSHHDHSQFRLPRSPEIIGLAATSPAQIAVELARMFPEFGSAQPFHEWYRDYLAQSASGQEA